MKLPLDKLLSVTVLTQKFCSKESFLLLFSIKF